MPAEIKAKLVLETEGGAPAAAVAPAAPAAEAEQTGILKEMSASFKTVSRSLKKPEAMFGGGGLAGILTKMIGAAVAGVALRRFLEEVFPELVGLEERIDAALSGDSTDTRNTIIDSIENWLDRVFPSDEEVIQSIKNFFDPDNALPKLPAAQPDLKVGEGVGDYWDVINAVDEIANIQERINELKEGGIDFDEQQELAMLEQAKSLFEQLTYSYDLTAEEETRLRLQIEVIGYLGQITTKTDVRLQSEKKITAELKLQLNYLQQMSRGGRGGFSHSGIGYDAGGYPMSVRDDLFIGGQSQSNIVTF